MKLTQMASALGIFFLLSAPSAAAPRYETVLLNARIVDGTGNPWFRGDVAIKDDVIAAIGDLEHAAADRRIDLAGRVLAPGFIDLMGQYSLPYIQDRGAAESKLRQGITTHVSGEGWSHAPQSSTTQPEGALIAGKARRWSRYSEYFRLLEEHGIPLNVVHNVGLGQVRNVVMGLQERPATRSEMDAMKTLVEQALADGANGVSSALLYPPDAFFTAAELIELTKVAARYNGSYYSHVRNHSSGFSSAVQEAIQIGEAAGVPVHIYHVKGAGDENWGQLPIALAQMNLARARGVDVTASLYPYVFNGVDLEDFLPASGRPELLARLDDPKVRSAARLEMEAYPPSRENLFQLVGMDWNRVIVFDQKSYSAAKIAGMSIEAAARSLGKDPWDLFFELARIKGLGVAMDLMNEGQIYAALREPWMMFSTDSSPVSVKSGAGTHPRAFGSFPRVFAKYVREDQAITLEDAVRRMTSLPAQTLGLRDRGQIATGKKADIVVFDPTRMRDRATLVDPRRPSEGVDFLLVNGKFVIDAGELKPIMPGKVLRHSSKTLR